MGKVLFGAFCLLLATPAEAARCGGGPPTPRVVMVSPAALEEDVPTNAVVVVHYQGSAVDRPDFARLSLRGPGGTPVDFLAEATPWPNGQTTTIRVTPLSPFEPETRYTLMGAFAYGEPVRLGSFTTGAGEDVVPPTLPAVKLAVSEAECACCRPGDRFQRVDVAFAVDEPIAIDVGIDGEVVAPQAKPDAYGILGSEGTFSVESGPDLYFPWRAPEGRHVLSITAFDRAGNSSTVEEASYDTEGCGCRLAPRAAPAPAALLVLLAAWYIFGHARLRRGGHTTRRRGARAPLPPPGG